MNNEVKRAGSKSLIIKVMIVIVLVALIGTMIGLLVNKQKKAKEIDTTKLIEQKKTEGVKLTLLNIGEPGHCPPCRAMEPIIADIKEKHKGRIDVLSFDTSTTEGMAIGREYEVSAIPTLVFLEGQEIKFRRSEAMSLEDIENKFKELGWID